MCFIPINREEKAVRVAKKPFPLVNSSVPVNQTVYNTNESLYWGFKIMLCNDVFVYIKAHSASVRFPQVIIIFWVEMHIQIAQNFNWFISVIMLLLFNVDLLSKFSMSTLSLK